MDSLQVFVFGDQWTDGTEWPCSAPGCPRKSNAIGLSEEEVNQVADTIPDASTVLKGQLQLIGPNAANYILEHKLGKVVCHTHR